MEYWCMIIELLANPTHLPTKIPTAIPVTEQINFGALVDEDVGNISGPNFTNIILEVVRVGWETWLGQKTILKI